MSRWISTGLLFSVLSVTGLLGYYINWSYYRAEREPHNVTLRFEKDVIDCSLERAVGLFYDNSTGLSDRLSRVVEASYGGCIDHADSLAQSRMEYEFELMFRQIKEDYCLRYNSGEFEVPIRYECEL